jgi:hypothetical protein
MVKTKPCCEAGNEGRVSCWLPAHVNVILALGAESGISRSPLRGPCSRLVWFGSFGDARDAGDEEPSSERLHLPW